MTQRDMRDLRDPRAMGIRFAALREEHPDWPATRIADEITLHHRDIALYPKDESTVQFTVPAYMKKMQEQAAQNDLAALRVLLDHGWALPEGLDQEVIERALRMGSAVDEVMEGP